MCFISNFIFFVNVLWLVVLLAGGHLAVLTYSHSKRTLQQYNNQHTMLILFEILFALLCQNLGDKAG